MDDFPFNFFNPMAYTYEHRRNLPHLEQRSICYFVTFCCADALPKAAIDSLEKKREIWCRGHGFPEKTKAAELLNRLKGQEKSRFQRFASTAYNRALDRGAGACLMSKPVLSKIVADSIDFHHQRNALIGDYVVMPNHVHLLIQPNDGIPLNRVLNSIRQYSARQINQALGREGRFWAREPFDHMVRSRHYFERYQQYIRANPGRAGLAQSQHRLKTWKWSGDDG